MMNLTFRFHDPLLNPLPLSHRDSTVSEVYYEVHMTCILHTTTISNVDNLMICEIETTLWAKPLLLQH